jgi:hypothetical protein
MGDTMSSRQKRKGYKFEHLIMKDLQEAGIRVERAGQANQPDLVIDGFGVMECKCWAKGLKFAYDILGGNEAAVVKWQSNQARGKEPIVFLRYESFKELLGALLKGATNAK